MKGSYEWGSLKSKPRKPDPGTQCVTARPPSVISPPWAPGASSSVPLASDHPASAGGCEDGPRGGVHPFKIYALVPTLHQAVGEQQGTRQTRFLPSCGLSSVRRVAQRLGPNAPNTTVTGVVSGRQSGFIKPAPDHPDVVCSGRLSFKQFSPTQDSWRAPEPPWEKGGLALCFLFHTRGC